MFLLKTVPGLNSTVKSGGGGIGRGGLGRIMEGGGCI